MHVDIHTINADEFELQEKNGRILIKPRPNKHIWAKEELHLRSLLLDQEGKVLSTGFPKFLNYGQCPEDDAELHWAVSTGQPIQLLEKLDGTLVIADNIDGEIHFRTRGSHDLGDFHEPVMKLVHERYPGIIGFLKSDTGFTKEMSFLFEYTGPENRIVVQYDEPQLTLLDWVSKSGKEVWSNAPSRSGMSLFMGGVPVVSPVGTLDHWVYNKPDINHVLELVRGWQNAEGVVARFRGQDGTVKRIKIKADQYVRIHALKFRLNNRRAKELAFILDIADPAQIAPQFHRLGIDEEVVSFVRPAVEEFIQDYLTAGSSYDLLLELTRKLRASCKYDRKEFVFAVKAILTEQEFPVVMKFYDARYEDAANILYSRVLNTTPSAIAKLREIVDANDYVTEIMKVQVPDDDA